MTGKHVGNQRPSHWITVAIVGVALILLATWAVFFGTDPSPERTATRSTSTESITVTGNAANRSGSEGTASLPPADELRTESVEEALTQPNVEIKGDVPDIFSSDQSTTMYVELAGNADGSNQRYLARSPLIGTVEMIFVDDRAYLRGDQKFWDTYDMPEYGSKYKETWIRMHPAEARELCWMYPRRTLRRALDEAEAVTDASAEDLVTVHGDDGYQVRQKSTANPRLEFAADDPHELTRVVGPLTDLTFSKWGEVPTIKAPEDVVQSEPYGPVEIPW